MQVTEKVACADAMLFGSTTTALTQPAAVSLIVSVNGVSELLMSIGKTPIENFAVFNTDATDHSDAGRETLLTQLVVVARRNHLKVDKAALAFKECGQIKFFGTPDLVRYLASREVPRWTHTLDV